MVEKEHDLKNEIIIKHAFLFMNNSDKKLFCSKIDEIINIFNNNDTFNYFL